MKNNILFILAISMAISVGWYYQSDKVTFSQIKIKNHYQNSMPDGKVKVAFKTPNYFGFVEEVIFSDEVTGKVIKAINVEENNPYTKEGEIIKTGHTISQQHYWLDYNKNKELYDNIIVEQNGSIDGVAPMISTHSYVFHQNSNQIAIVYELWIFEADLEEDKCGETHMLGKRAVFWIIDKNNGETIAYMNGINDHVAHVASTKDYLAFSNNNGNYVKFIDLKDNIDLLTIKSSNNRVQRLNPPFNIGRKFYFDIESPDSKTYLIYDFEQNTKYQKTLPRSLIQHKWVKLTESGIEIVDLLKSSKAIEETLSLERDFKKEQILKK